MHPEVAGGAGAHKEVHRGVLGRRGLDLLKISKKISRGVILGGSELVGPSAVIKSGITVIKKHEKT